MIPAGTDGSVRLGGLVMRDHWFDAPLDHHFPAGESITLYAREVVAADAVASGAAENQPWLLFLQGGPGGEATRPIGRTGWIGRAVQDYRVLLMDQRGTGRSTPATAQTLTRRGSPAAQAEYLASHRADAIVADAEYIRRTLLGPEGRWSILGQSYGGFCALSYLSFAPAHLDAAMLTGGLAPLTASADDVYHATSRLVEAKNEAFVAAYPAARERLDAVVSHLRERGPATLPDGSPLTVERFLSIGKDLGTHAAQPGLAYLLAEAFVASPSGSQAGEELSDTFLAGVYERVSFATAPLYAVVHESIYGQSLPTRWAAQRVRDTLPQFAPSAEAPLLTGEMIYPWMFDVDPSLRALRETAEVLAERSWTPLYDLDTLAVNEVPAAAALYTDDMFVDAGLSRQTVRSVRGLRAWETNEYEHDGLRESDQVLDRLIRMTRGEL